jgi:hypothetical protein
LFAAHEGQCGVQDHPVSHREVLVSLLLLNLRKLRGYKKRKRKKKKKKKKKKQSDDENGGSNG